MNLMLKQSFEHKIHGPFIKKLCENIQQRFPDVELLEAFTLFDQNKLPGSFDEVIESNYGIDKVSDTLGKHFGSLDHQVLRMDWTNFRVYMMQCCRDMSMKAVLLKLATNSTLQQMYPLLHKLAQICLIIPVSTADCEQGFSAMRRVKTKLRNQMKNSTFNHCLRIFIVGPPIAEFDFSSKL